MRQPMRFVTLAVIAASVAVMAGCSSKITEEQLAQMRQLRQQESTLQSQLRSKRDEKTRLSGEVNRLRADLDQCGKDKAFVQGKLAQWPDVWPDWKYVPEGGGTDATPRRPR